MAAVTGVLAVALLISGLTLLGALAAVAAVAAGSRARQQFRLAHRARRGMSAEARIDLRLRSLLRRGWLIGRGIPVPKNGDIDHVAIAPAPGPTFVIETKASAYTWQALRRTRRVAALFTDGVPVLVTISPRRTRPVKGVTVCCEENLVAVLCELHTQHRARRAREAVGAREARRAAPRAARLRTAGG